VFVTGSTAQGFSPYVLGGFDISAKETAPTSIAFSDDGTKMYVYGSISDAVHQYTLSTAWDVSSAVFLQSFAIADGSPNGLAFSSDGLKLYSIGTSSVREHTLSTAWNISTATFVRVQSFAFTTGEALSTGIYFDSTGTRVYTTGSGSDNVYQYSLATAWNISTVSYVRAKSVSAQDTSPQDVFFKPDGKTMYVLGQVGGVGVSPGLLQYTLSTAWDISTATFTRFKPTETEENTATGFTFKPDGTKMYIVGTKNRVFQYSLGVE
jgi:DNA-binding beta-propeller fold protein YncE